MKEIYDAVIVIGKFRVFHKKHQELIDLARTKGSLTCFLGSSNRLPRSVVETRRKVMEHLGIDYVEIIDLECSDESWAISIQELIMGFLLDKKLSNALVIYAHDGENDWHELLRNNKIDVLKVERVGTLSSTFILDSYFHRRYWINEDLHRFYDRMVLRL